MTGNSIGILNLLSALFPARVGQVGSGATTTSIPTTGKKYIPGDWANGYIYFVTGAAVGQFAQITNNDTNNDATTFTVSGLTVAPGEGDVFCLYPKSHLTAMPGGNIEQWGGTSLTGRDISQDLANLDIALSALRDDLRAMFQPLSAYNSSTGAPLTVDLDTGPYGGRTVVEVWVKSSAAATFNVYGSRDGTNWRLADTITLSEAGEEHRGYQSAYRYLRVSTSDANDNEAEIVASR